LRNIGFLQSRYTIVFGMKRFGDFLTEHLWFSTESSCVLSQQNYRRASGTFFKNTRLNGRLFYKICSVENPISLCRLGLFLPLNSPLYRLPQQNLACISQSNYFIVRLLAPILFVY